MGKLKLSLLFALVLCATSAHIPDHRSQSTAEKVTAKVEIFYETLNEEVRKFIVEEFKPVKDHLLDGLQVSFYPYGTTTNNAGVYECEYGEVQCTANKFHACFIKAQPSPTQKETSDFVHCFIKNRFSIHDVEVLAQECLPATLTADWSSILNCVNSAEDKVTGEFEAITGEVVNDIKDFGLVVRLDDQVTDYLNIASQICVILGQEGDMCSETARKLRLNICYEAFNQDSTKYLVRQLATFYHVLEDFVEVKLLPYGLTKFQANKYSCTGGEAQCISNKFQTLVVEAFMTNQRNGDPVSSQKRALDFVSCVMQSTMGSVFKALEQCTSEKLRSDDYKTFIEHIKTDSSFMKTAFASMRSSTEDIFAQPSVKSASVPMAVVASQVNYDAFNNLVQQLCTSYTGKIKPDICTRVSVIVLYEPDQHKSRTFFLEQLSPTMSGMYNLIDLTLIPAGRASIGKDSSISCPGSSQACNATKVQACALDLFWNKGASYPDLIVQQLVDFVSCTFKNAKLSNDDMSTAEDCSTQYLRTNSWTQIQACLNNGTGDEILIKYIADTADLIKDIVNPTFPIVLVNQEPVSDLNSLHTTLCAGYDEYNKPEVCINGLPQKVPVNVFYEAMSERTRDFFLTQYDPIPMEEMINLELYPAGNVQEMNFTDGTCDSEDGTSACMANKIQATVIDRYAALDDDTDSLDGTLRTMLFIECVFGHSQYKTDVLTAAELCTNQTLPAEQWTDLLAVVKSASGKQIYKKVLDFTAQYKQNTGLESIDPLPWVTLDNQNYSQRAADSLLETVCSLYQGDKPIECTLVHVEIYYSALNVDSRQFFLYQLFPSIRSLGERTRVELIPYGIVNASLSAKEECIDREDICLANKVHACAIDYYHSQQSAAIENELDGRNETLSLVTCMMRNAYDLNAIDLVAKCTNNSVAEQIVECAQGQQGTDLLEAMRAKTLEQYENMQQVPWIVINGFRQAAQMNLSEVICANMKGNVANNCGIEPIADKVTVQFHYSSLDADSQQYVLNSLYPVYRQLEEIIELELVPFGLMDIARIDTNTATLTCPNGVEECLANQIHACVLSLLPTGTVPSGGFDFNIQAAQFVQCYFNSDKYPQQSADAALECVDVIFGDEQNATIIECVQSHQSIAILEQMQKDKVAPLVPSLTRTPWLAIDGKYSYTSEFNLERSICDVYTGSIKPQFCYAAYDDSYVALPTVEIHYEVNDAGSKHFFTTKFKPSEVLTIATLKLVPFGRSTYTSTSKQCVNDEGCELYKQHACLIKLYSESNGVETGEAIACTFGESGSNAFAECVQQHFDDFLTVVPAIAKCVTDDGDKLMNENSQLVQQLLPTRISHVPWVTINAVLFNAEDPQMGLVNQICSVYYPGDKPPLCQPELVHVGVYYETHDAQVNSFIRSQLSGYVDYLDEIAQFTFIPYGNGSSSDNGQRVVCNLEELQCHDNIAHTCLLKRYYGEEEQQEDRIGVAHFLSCTAEEAMSGVANVTAECFVRNFESERWPDIEQCATGDEGATLYEEMGRLTAALYPPLSAVPHLTVDSVYSPQAADNLLQTLCYTDKSSVKSPLCATLPKYAIRVGIYFSANVAAQEYFTEQMLPFYQDSLPPQRTSSRTSSTTRLSEIIVPNLIAWGNTTYSSTSEGEPFVCTDGPNECYINRFFACAAFHHAGEPQTKTNQMKFALCFFTNANVFNNTEEILQLCTRQTWIPDPFEQLKSCASDNSPEGIAIYLLMRDQTENDISEDAITFPAITINNKYNSTAEQNLLESVCETYQGFDYPVECEQWMPTYPSVPTTDSTNETPKPTTPKPGGSGSVPTVSFPFLFGTILLSFFLFDCIYYRLPQWTAITPH